MHTTAEEGMVRFKHKGNVPTHWGNYWGWELFINQGWRYADLLAVCNDGSFLLQYEMPSGNRYGHIVKIDRNGKFAPSGSSAQFHRLSAKWNDAQWIQDPF